MSEPLSRHDDERVLVLATQDGETSRAVLAEAGIPCFACADLTDVCCRAVEGAGAVLLTDEALATGDARSLEEVLQLQPAWSDLPVLLLTRDGSNPPFAGDSLARLGNAVVLERPVRVPVLVSALRAALESRRRQYQVRDQLAEQRRLEEELRLRAAELADAARRKDEFLAMLAHELRNPLAPLRNALLTERLLDPTPQAGVVEARDRMDRQVQHLVRLVDDLLDLSRITQGKVQLRRERVEIAHALSRAIESARPFIDGRRHQLVVELPSEPLALDADPVRVAQIILNLLDNAAKYTPERGLISLTAAREGNQAVVRVRDTGIGIAAEMLPRVFDLFTQLGRTSGHGESGLGIGLTLVRQLVTMHGGSVEAESAGPGKGSEFVVRLPLALPAPVDSKQPPAGTPGGGVTHRILVVDDNRDSAESLALLLRLYGHEVHTALDGHQALARATACQPDVVVLDIDLPEMDGWEVCRRLREISELNAATIVALTGFGQEQDRRRSERAGFNLHMVKPVDIAALRRLLAELPAARPTRCC